MVSNFTLFSALFKFPALTVVWCAVIKNFVLFLFFDESTPTWYSNPVVFIFLSVVQESNDNVKLFLIESLNITVDSGSGMKAEKMSVGKRIINVTVISVAKVVKEIFPKPAVLEVILNPSSLFARFTNCKYTF